MSSSSSSISNEQFETFVIVGGGIAGLATAVALQRVGLKSLVLERADSLRTTGAALTLMTNAWRALDALGVAQSLRLKHPQLQGAQVTSFPSAFTKQISYTGSGKCGDHEVRCVQRSVLLETLAKELAPGTIRFNTKVVSIQQSTNSSLTIVKLGDGALIKAKVLIGCDGGNSVVADWLGLQAPSLSGRSAIRGLATYPEGHKFGPKVQLYWGEHLRAGFVPCNEKDIYWFTTQSSLPSDSDIGRDPKSILEKAMEILGDYPEEILDIVKKTQIDTLTLTPLSLRWPWAVLFGKLCKGNVCVAGDAMHPMTPDLGQGGCSTLEDAVVLGRCLGEITTVMNGLEEEKKIEEALKKYVEERRWRSFGLISGAYITGVVQQGSGGVITRFLRDKFLSRKLSENLMNQADFDCGTLSSCTPT
jgi:2-polyprenyl-6-methoxyphenol hydroxylase-like FAD-dependent oxidoreductase